MDGIAKYYFLGATIVILMVLLGNDPSKHKKKPEDPFVEAVRKAEEERKSSLSMGQGMTGWMGAQGGIVGGGNIPQGGIILQGGNGQIGASYQYDPGNNFAVPPPPQPQVNATVPPINSSAQPNNYQLQGLGQAAMPPQQMPSVVPVQPGQPASPVSPDAAPQVPAPVLVPTLESPFGKPTSLRNIRFPDMAQTPTFRLRGGTKVQFMGAWVLTQDEKGEPIAMPDGEYVMSDGQSTLLVVDGKRRIF